MKFSLSPKTVGLIIGWFNIFLTIVKLYIAIANAIFIYVLEGNLYNLDLDLNRVLLTVAFVLIIYGVFSILLLVGIYRENEELLLPWLIFNLVNLGVLAIMFFKAYLGRPDTVSAAISDHPIKHVLWLALLIWELEAISSLRIQMKKEKSIMQYSNLEVEKGLSNNLFTTHLHTTLSNIQPTIHQHKNHLGTF